MRRCWRIRQKLLRLQPELAGQLDLYKSQLGDLQTTLGQIRVMLLARQASLESRPRATLCRLAMDGRVPADALKSSHSNKLLEHITRHPEVFRSSVRWVSDAKVARMECADFSADIHATHPLYFLHASGKSR